MNEHINTNERRYMAGPEFELGPSSSSQEIYRCATLLLLTVQISLLF